MENENDVILAPEEENLPPPVIEKINLAEVEQEKKAIEQEEIEKNNQIELNILNSACDNFIESVLALNDEEVKRVQEIIYSVKNEEVEDFSNIKEGENE